MFVDLTTNAKYFLFSSDPAGTTKLSIIRKENIIRVTAIFIPASQAGSAAPSKSPDYQVNMDFPTKTVGSIEFTGDTIPMTFELQKVTNQGTWSAGTQAACDAFINDVQAAL